MNREFPYRPKTEVYLNPKGNIVIKQEQMGEDQFVWFEADQIDTLITWLQDARREREEDWQPEEAEEDEEGD